MKKTEDQRIADKIRDVFENFEDPSSEQGWQELRKKYPETRTRPLFFWYSSAAAVIAVLFWFFFFNNTSNQTRIITEKNYASAPKSSQNLQSESSITNQQQVNNNSADKVHFRVSHVIINDNIKQQEVEQNSAPTLFAERSEPKFEEKTQELNVPLNSLSEPSMTQNQQKQTSELAQNNNQENNNSPGTLKDLKTENQEEKKVKTPKNIVIGVYAGSFVSYADGSEGNVNLGAGLSSDFRLNRRLKLSTGISLSKNRLSYNENSPSNDYGSFQVSQGIAAGTFTAINDYQAELLNLDIPINLKYSLSPGKNSAYVQAGLSSGTYITERYAINSSSFNSMIGTSSNPDKQVINKSLEHFDLLRTLNFSFGFNTRIGKNQSLGIEPFVKYPLGNLGSENLRFGSTGINVKLNLNSLKHQK